MSETPTAPRTFTASEVDAAVDAALARRAAAEATAKAESASQDDIDRAALDAAIAAHVTTDRAKRKRFGLEDARALYETMPRDPLYRTWMAVHGRPPREVGSNYPVRMFGSSVVSFYPGSDSHATGRAPSYE